MHEIPLRTDEDKQLVEQLLAPLGTIEPLPAERLLDVVTAVSGSGPAYVFILAEVLAAAAEQEGLDKDVALRLASRTVAGAGALMLRTGETPNALRKAVTSPGGTTVGPKAIPASTESTNATDSDTTVTVIRPRPCWRPRASSGLEAVTGVARTVSGTLEVTEWSSRQRSASHGRAIGPVPSSVVWSGTRI